MALAQDEQHANGWLRLSSDVQIGYIHRASTAGRSHLMQSLADGQRMGSACIYATASGNHVRVLFFQLH
jgi:hypothetical protein